MTTRRPDPLLDADVENTQPIFRADQAFVVQFGSSAVLGDDCLGRVEHVVSGHSSRFATTGEMVGFMDAVRREVASGGAPTGPNQVSKGRQIR